MALTLVTFKCGACNNLMAAGEDLRGRPVRCPHCQQVVQVPPAEAIVPVPAQPVAAGPNETAPFSPPPAQASAPGTNGSAADSSVNIALPEIKPAQEDSIHDARRPRDDLFDDPDEEPFLDFGEPSPKPAEVNAELAPVSAAPVDSPVPVPAPELTTAAVEEPTFSWNDVASDAYAGPLAAAPVPAASVAEHPTTAPTPENHWDQPSRAAPRTERAANRNIPAAASPAVGRAKPKLPASTWALSIVVPYAITVTCISLFLIVRASDKPVHPLESLADDGLYKELQEGKAPTVVDPTELLPKDFKPLKLNETRESGGIAVTALEVRKEKLAYTYFKTASDPGGPSQKDDYDSLVLRLRIKNISNLVFHPVDPVFNCRDRKALKSYTYLQVRDKRFCGPIFDPSSERIKGQNFSELFPGQEMETIIIASYDGDTPTRAEDVLKGAKKDESLTWRVQLRKGRETVQLKRGGKASPWTTTIVPVTFTPADVK